MATTNDDDRELWSRVRAPAPDPRELKRAYDAFLAGQSLDETLLANDPEIAAILAEARHHTPSPALAQVIHSARAERTQSAHRFASARAWMTLAASVTLAAGMGLYVGQVASDRTKQKQNTRPLALWVADADGLDGLVALEEQQP